MTALALPPHPGRNVAEEKVLDFVLLGRAPEAPRRIIVRLVADGLLLKHYETRRDALGSYEVPRYTLPELVRGAIEDHYIAQEIEDEGR